MFSITNHAGKTAKTLANSKQNFRLAFRYIPGMISGEEREYRRTLATFLQWPKPQAFTVWRGLLLA